MSSLLGVPSNITSVVGKLRACRCGSRPHERPRAVILNGQSVKTTERGGTHAFDAYKRGKDGSTRLVEYAWLTDRQPGRASGTSGWVRRRCALRAVGHDDSLPIQVPNAQFAYSSADSLATRSSVYRSSTVRRAAAANLWRASTFRISVSSC